MGKLFTTETISCIHCHPRVLWIETTPGKAPEFIFYGFPQEGRALLTLKRVHISCGRCAPRWPALQANLENANVR